MRSALLLPSQNALDQLSRFPRPSQERINYLVQEFRQQISNLMSLVESCCAPANAETY